MRAKKNTPIAALIVGLIAVIAVGAYFVFNKKTEVPVTPVIREPLKLGGIVPMTGTRAAYGIPLQRAAQLAVDEINKKGGIFGDQIQILWEDGKCAPTAAKNAADKLVNKSKVQIIFGGVCSQETIAAAAITEPAKVLLISPASTSADITKAGDYVFRLTQSDSLVGAVSAKYLFNKVGAKKVALIRENTAYITGIADGFKEAYESLGGEITYDKSYATGARGSAIFTSEAAKTNPDVIYLLPDSPTQGLQQLERIHENKVTIPLMLDEVLLDRALIAANPEFFEGALGVESYFDAGSPRAKKFLEAYQDQYAEEPKFPYFMSNMYDAVYLMRDAVLAVGTDPDKLKDWLLSQKRRPGVAGDISFDANGDYLAKFSVVKVVDGKLELQEIFDTASQ